MAIEQGMAAGEGLHQPHQGVVDGLVAMGVVLAKDVTNDAGTFAVRTIGGKPQLLHRKQDAALHWLEAVAHIGEGPPHDHAHGVFEVGTLHLLMQGDRLDSLPVLLLGHPLLVSEDDRRSAYRSRRGGPGPAPTDPIGRPGCRCCRSHWPGPVPDWL